MAKALGSKIAAVSQPGLKKPKTDQAPTPKNSANRPPSSLKEAKDMQKDTAKPLGKLVNPNTGVVKKGGKDDDSDDPIA